MGNYHFVGNADGWSKPVYADEWGNIVSEEEVERERLKEEIKEDITHILFDATGHTPIVIPVINKV